MAVTETTTVPPPVAPLDIKAFAEPQTHSLTDPPISFYRDWPNDAGFNASAEQHEPRELVVTGEFPLWAAGSLVRAGPGAYKVDKINPDDKGFACSHWFDGFSLIHKFEITSEASGSAKVYYQSRSQVDGLVEKARRTGKLAGITFGQKRDPCETFYAKMKSSFAPPTAGGVNMENIGVSFQPAFHRKRDGANSSDDQRRVLTVTSDKSSTEDLDVKSLKPITVTEQKDLHKDLKGGLSAAHPCFDPVTGDVYNYNLELKARPEYHIFKISAKTGATEVIATIPNIKGAYIHSFFITEHFLILCEWPAYYKKSGVQILWERNILDAIAFDASAKSTWFVIDRVQGKGVVRKFTSPAMFAFHSVNAWEEQMDDGKVDILCDLCQFKNMDILYRFYYENMISSSKTAFAYGNVDHLALARYRLRDISAINTSQSKKVAAAEQVMKVTAPRAGDLPRINEKYATKPHRYVYTAMDTGRSSFIDSIGKTDMSTGECVPWCHLKHSPGEPVFIARPDGEAEDDGVLLSVVLDGEKGTSYLLCLDARDMKEIARADVAVPVAFGFHGVHLTSR